MPTYIKTVVEHLSGHAALVDNVQRPRRCVLLLGQQLVDQVEQGKRGLHDNAESSRIPKNICLAIPMRPR